MIPKQGVGLNRRNRRRNTDNEFGIYKNKNLISALSLCCIIIIQLDITMESFISRLESSKPQFP